MPDNNSTDSSPERSSSNPGNNLRRQVPHDGTFQNTALDSSVHLAGLIAEFQELHRNMSEREAEIRRNPPDNMPLPTRGANINFTSLRSQASAIPGQPVQGANGTTPLLAMEPSDPAHSVIKKPVTTLVSSLPQTTYSDQKDSAETTLEYIKVQRAVLDYLGKRAADTLTQRQACAWTAAIEPTTKKPAAQDALRLCYYMRSQGFDTYAGLKGKILLLFVAEPNGQDGGEVLPYWKQDFSTDQIIHSVSSELRNANGRRNAIVGGHAPPVGGGHNLGTNDMFAGMRGSGPFGPIPGTLDNPEDAGRYEDGEVDWAGELDVLDAMLTRARTTGYRTQQAPTARQPPPPPPPAQGQAQRTQLEARMAEAQANLDNILSATTSNPGLIESAISQVEGIQRLLDQV
ncbi:predicted protein [Plenodomus lingam JN3]|uniref:Predicted protein n=1 Tax=Leptosphaeria maculans (strain JN3 / isolate v23.1.3 / race Av1-4-5-6-7-8) TaxID=985895 RepID=E5AAK0_LEPMJ|nr:predicted protein [Plenodomus lingam JN3]CBY00691.1 predicted protein [Plenodomus lingam JN3]